MFECFLEILLRYWADCVLLFFDAGLMAHIGIRIDHEILNQRLLTLSEMGVSQMQHFFL